MRNTVIVTGDRKLNDYELVKKCLDELTPEMIVQGGATGADDLARKYANEKGIPLVTFHANWNFYDRQAGPIRNKQMLTTFTYATLLAFPRGGPGTVNCMTEAKKLGMKIIIK